MKLKELLERDIRTVPGGKEAVTPKLTRISSKPLGKIKRLGGGIQGTAFKHLRIPNTVIKTAKVNHPETDGYVKFIKLALDHQNNPFFPKIYNAVLRELSADIYAFELIIQMERLHKITSEELFDVTPQLFKRLGFKLDDLEDMWDYLNDPDIWKHLIEKTKNPQFAEALSLILSVDPALRAHDLHTDNWMIRLTSVGPQLVVIDPFSGQIHS